MVATIDSAGGLPIKRNPTCVLGKSISGNFKYSLISLSSQSENNPYYSLRVHRPTDFRICVSQYSLKGNKSNFPIHPVSIFLIKNPAHLKTPVRLEKLNKDDVVAYTGFVAALFYIIQLCRIYQSYSRSSCSTKSVEFVCKFLRSWTLCYHGGHQQCGYGWELHHQVYSILFNQN